MITRHIVLNEHLHAMLVALLERQHRRVPGDGDAFKLLAIVRAAKIVTTAAAPEAVDLELPQKESEP